MVDVRYGRLVKRHAAADLSHGARTNSGRPRKARKPRRRRQSRGSEAHWNPDPPKRRRQTFSEAQQKEITKKLAGFKAARLAAKKVLVAKKKRADIDLAGAEQDFQEARRSFDAMAKKYPNLAPKGRVEASAGRRDESGKPIPGSITETYRTFKKKGSADDIALRPLNPYEQAEKDLATASGTLTLVRTAVSALEGKVSDISQVLKGISSARSWAAKDDMLDLLVSWEDAGVEGEPSLPERFTAGMKPVGQAKPKPAVPIKGEGRKGGTESGLMERFTGSEREIPDGGGYLVLPDPPRFEKDRSGRSGELCGNPIDGVMYVAVIPAQKRPLIHVLTREDWKAIVDDLKTAQKLPPTDLAELKAALFPMMQAGGYTQVSEKGSEWVLSDEDNPFSSKQLEPFTLEEVQAIQGKRVLDTKGGIGQNLSAAETRLQGELADLRAKKRSRKAPPASFQPSLKGKGRLKRWRDRLASQIQAKEASLARLQKQMAGQSGFLSPQYDAEGRKKGAKTERRVHRSQLPANTFFFPYGGRDDSFVAILLIGRMSPSVKKFRDFFSPPYHPTSGRRKSPFFSWVNLDRPLAAGSKNEGFAEKPLCLTREHRQLVDSTRKALAPVSSMRRDMVRMGHILVEAPQDKHANADSLGRAAGRALSTLAWFASWAQNVAITKDRVPRELISLLPEVQLFDAITASGDNPGGLRPAEVIEAALTRPIPLLVRDPKRKAKIFGLNQPGLGKLQRELGKRVDVKKMPKRFVGVPLSKTGIGWAKLETRLQEQEEAAKRGSKGKKKAAAEEIKAIQRQMGGSVIESLEGTLRLRLTQQEKAQLLATLITDKLVSGKFIRKQERGPLRNKLEMEAFDLFDLTREREISRLREALRRSNLPANVRSDYKKSLARLITQESRLLPLRAIFFIYHSLGGEKLIRQLDAAMGLLARVREDAGRLPKAQDLRTQEDIRTLERQLSGKYQKDVDDTEEDEKRKREEYRRRQGVDRDLLKATREHARRISKGQALRRLGDVRLFYTFNPLLFKVTRDWWDLGRLWPRKDGVPLRKKDDLLREIDQVGRYGHSLQLIYESGMGQADLSDALGQLHERLDSGSFMTGFAQDWFDPDEKLSAGDLMHKHASILRDDHPDLELLEPGASGTGGWDVLHHKAPDEAGEVGDRGWIVPVAQGTPPEDVMTEGHLFAEDPTAYLSNLRVASSEAMMEADRKLRAERALHRRRTAAAREEDLAQKVERARHKKEQAARRAAGKKPLPEKAPLKIGDVRGLQVRGGERMQAVNIPSTPQYQIERTGPFSGQTDRTKSRIPQKSAVAALEHLDEDASRLRNLIQLRLKQLSSK